MLRKILIVVLAASLAACASVQRLDAASDVHALLVAIRDNDQAAFDAHVDRAALKRDLQLKLEKRIDKRLGGFAAILGPSVIDVAGDALVQPSVFRLVARHYGYRPETPLPNVIQVAAAVKPLPDGRACIITKKDGPCLMTFTKEAGVWKLTSFNGDFSMLTLRL
jgi:hypothetical protein